MDRPEIAFCYVTDTGYALPSLISASAVRDRFAPEAADVFIFAFGMEAAPLSSLTREAARRRVNVLPLNGAASKSFDPTLFQNGYISMAAMGRFFIADALPRFYRQIIYIDGDTWITDQIQQIANAVPAEGMMAGVEDPLISYSRGDIGPYGTWVRAYYKSLGLPPDTQYINSGVLMASTATWQAVSKDALAYYLAQPDRCVHPDQSALNAVLGTRKKIVSPRWNCTTQLLYFDVERAVKPAIYHFTGPAKPWMGRFEPWTHIALEYEERLKTFAGTGLPMKVFSDSEAAAQTKNTRRFVFGLRTVKRLRLIARRRSVRRALEAEAH